MIEAADKVKSALYAGALLAFMAAMGAGLGMEPALSHFAGLACWIFFLFAAAFKALLTENALLTEKTSSLPRIALWSCVAGALAELLNLRLAVWQYTAQPATLTARWGGWLLLWSSWLPALLAIEELLAGAGLERRLRTSPFKLPAIFPVLLGGAGGALLLAALVWPARLWFLSAAGPLLLIEALCLRFSLPSLLRELQGGLPWRSVQIAAAGLLLGLLRQLFNSFSGAAVTYAGGEGGWTLLGLAPAAYAAYPLAALASYSLFRTLESLQAKAAAGSKSGPLLQFALPAFALLLIFFAMRLVDRHSVAMFLGWV